MRILVHVGPEGRAASDAVRLLAGRREALAGRGILHPRSLSGRQHALLTIAALDPDHIDPMRARRGYASAEAQEQLGRQIARRLGREIRAAAPEQVTLAAGHAASRLRSAEEIARFRALLEPFSDDIRVIFHVEEQCRALAAHYAWQVTEGRTAPLSRELAMSAEDWAAEDAMPEADGPRAIVAPPVWLDHAATVARWQAVFGADGVTVRTLPNKPLTSEVMQTELRTAFELPGSIGKVDLEPPEIPSAAHLERMRQINLRLAAKEARLPMPVRRRLWSEAAADGPAIAPGELTALASVFRPGNAALAEAFKGVTKTALTPPKRAAAWQPPVIADDFDPDQVVEAALARLTPPTPRPRPRRARKQARKREEAPQNGLSAAADLVLSEEAKAAVPSFAQGRLAPRNDVVAFDEATPLPATKPHTAQAPRDGSTGSVIVGCMKNEGPFLLEWIAYHRSIGVDTFLLYTNDCEDGTDALLDRLAALGVLHHEDNSSWKGQSPQQAALNRAIEHPALQNAEWIIHIDTDEFINIRHGDGTLPELYEAVGPATNIAMTWRLFGHGGVQRYDDAPVIAQFERCAPSYLPKPHTAWGFKTIVRNIGAYAKLSCHRPNKLEEEHADQVRWVNGSGHDVTKSYLKNGWRSDTKTIGYDLVQLNHYALRSAQSFLVKRQRGRALHVDRSIGLNYWIRMDFNSCTDVTIQRHVPRMEAELARLMEDAEVARLHAAAVAWHREKAETLMAVPEFRALYDQVTQLDLTDAERIAAVVTADMES
ncbi:MAG: glycosyltransferase family 2 protein [Pseudomonadota bacterium]